MADPVGLRLREGARLEYFDRDGFDLMNGDYVLVDTEMGQTIAMVSEVNPYVPRNCMPEKLPPVLGFASSEDWTRYDQRAAEEAEALEVAREKAEAHGLDMHVERALYSEDRSKLMFHFTAENRVDFRDLVRDLAAIFHTRIELRQIGVREDAQVCGGLGVCGRELCCASFLNNFDPVSIKMVKSQNISLNPTKISGHCGRLMCCLNYEHEMYVDQRKLLPKVGHTIRTPQGEGKVVDLDVLRERITVQPLDEATSERLTFTAEELGYGAAKAKRQSHRSGGCGGCQHHGDKGETLDDEKDSTL